MPFSVTADGFVNEIRRRTRGPAVPAAEGARVAVAGIVPQGRARSLIKLPVADEAAGRADGDPRELRAVEGVGDRAGGSSTTVPPLALTVVLLLVRLKRPPIRVVTLDSVKLPAEVELSVKSAGVRMM